MAEDSIPHDGTTVGHAASNTIWDAPYSSAEWSDFMSKLLGSDAASGFVIPGYGNNLEITEAGTPAMSVLVDTGAAFVRGRLYENTAQATVSISAADGANPRLDYIVIKFDASAQTITLAKHDGTAAATPSLPTLTQTALVYEIPIAYVWVATGTTTIVDEDIHDVRSFGIGFNALSGAIQQDNLIQNSEFMAFSRLSTASSKAGTPDKWEASGSATFAAATRPSQMSRGRAVAITAAGSSVGMTQTVNCVAGQIYTLKLLMKVTAGDVGFVTLEDDQGTTITRNIRRTGSWYEITARITTDGAATTLTLTVGGITSGDVIDVGQCLLTQGYSAGDFRTVRERIIFDHILADTSWDGDAKAANTYTLDLDSNFEALVLDGTVAVYVWAGVSWANMASTGTTLLIKPYNDTNTVYSFGPGGAGLPNNLILTMLGWISIDSNRGFKAIVDQSSPSCYLRIMGIQI